MSINTGEFVLRGAWVQLSGNTSPMDRYEEIEAGIKKLLVDVFGFPQNTDTKLISWGGGTVSPVEDIKKTDSEAVLQLSNIIENETAKANKDHNKLVKRKHQIRLLKGLKVELRNK